MEEVLKPEKEDYKKLAVAVVWIHWIWIAFIATGFVIQFIDPRYIAVEISGLIITIIAQLIWKDCPLTILENELRDKARQKKYRKTFTAHYLQKFLELKITSNFLVGQITLIVMTIVSIILYIAK